jgi:hypothetical protein
MDGPPFFRNVDQISLYTPDEAALFVELSPYSYLEQMRKKDYTLRGFGDIAYNLAVTPNVEGVFCLRGLCNKPPVGSPTSVSVLVLLGNEEPPTDLLLFNLIQAKQLIQARFPNATQINSKLPFKDFWETKLPEQEKLLPNLTNSFTQTTSVHVFDLIEQLAFWGYYKGRNDGVYGPVTKNAVSQLQADLKDGRLYLKRVDGLYGRYTREAFLRYLRQF